jgi:pyruvate,water dikinase
VPEAGPSGGSPTGGPDAHRRATTAGFGGGGTAGDQHVADGLVDLEDARAANVDLVGGKAASLARAMAHGLPVLPGVVVTTGADLDGLSATSEIVAGIRWKLGRRPVVARSSSPMEDTADSAMAGQFATIPNLLSDEELAEGILGVARSGERIAEENGLDEVPPVAVLVQTMILRPAFGGVCFGVDPLTGRKDRRLVVASTSGPDPVVSGEVAGVRHLVDPDGRLLRRDGDSDPGAELDRATLRELIALVDRLGELFGSPQDMEFLVERDGTLCLLQSRPVTTEVRGTPSGPVYGPGPVAETFPDPLGPLEEDLWVPPLAEGMREALRLTALASTAHLRDRPLVAVVDGYVALDLEVVDPPSAPRTWWQKLSPSAYTRKAHATWRVGRLKAALPFLARDLVVRADDSLSAVGPLDDLSDRELLGVLQRSHDALRALHGHEVLMGLLTTGGSRLTGASVALRALAVGRAEGLTDDEIIARSPAVLALAGPRIDGPALPSDVKGVPPPLPSDTHAHEAGVLREALRLRVRWVQELTARVARELGSRLAERGLLPDPLWVTGLRLDELVGLVTGAVVAVPANPPEPPEERRRRARPLPARFQLDDEGRAVPLEGTGRGGGTGASGGVGRGPVCLDVATVEPGAVLVVRELRPELASHLGQIAGLVAETGSPLAHMAILAREASVPTVVGFAGATSTFKAGQHVEVDGDAGSVETIEETT